MQQNEWIKEFPAAITICDTNGKIIEMNDRSILTFNADGGSDLIGKNILDCHPEPARTKLNKLLTEKMKNVYTIEKNGIKKIIYQSPWFKNGKYSGMVELSLEIPFELPHFIRK
jgi:transcriptional regulator with PAS, ATPase and Fis domain